MLTGGLATPQSRMQELEKLEHLKSDLAQLQRVRKKVDAAVKALERAIEEAPQKGRGKKKHPKQAELDQKKVWL